MAGGIPTSTTTTVASGDNEKINYALPLAIMVSLFFMIGFITVLNDVLAPRLRGLFDLSNADTMMIMFVFFGAYLVWSYPAGALVKRIGYKKGIIAAMATVGTGLAVFVPAAHFVVYSVFLVALFITASGLAILQVCINPYIIALGPEKTGASRLNLGGALNSTATFIGPIVGGAFILQHIPTPDFPNPSDIEKIEASYGVVKLKEDVTPQVAIQSVKSIFAVELVIDENPAVAARINKAVANVDEKIEAEPAQALLNQVKNDVEDVIFTKSFARLKGNSADVWWAYKLKKADSVLVPYVGLCVVTFLLAIALVYIRLPKIASEKEAIEHSRDGTKPQGSALDYSHMWLGALAIFFYVGVEVAIGVQLIFYVEEPHMGGLDHQKAAYLLAYYWGSAMIGRFIGFYVGTKIPAEKLLRFVVVAALVLLGASYLPPFLDIFVDVPVIALELAPFSLGMVDVSVPLAAVALVLCGLCHSVMWPAIFPLGIAKLGEHTSQGAGILVMGVFGGAVIPLLVGLLADSYGFQVAFLVCAVCYLYIAYFAFSGYRAGKIGKILDEEAKA